eukprot:jgi/Chrzof1/8048/UNPLg00093.t1
MSETTSTTIISVCLLPDFAIMSLPVLVIFARMPVPGKAKTRLGAAVGPQAAADFYKACAEHILRQAYSCSAVTCQVHCSEAAEVEQMQGWLNEIGTPMNVLPQVNTPDLGVRIFEALTMAISDLPSSSRGQHESPHDDTADHASTMQHGAGCSSELQLPRTSHTINASDVSSSGKVGDDAAAAAAAAVAVAAMTSSQAPDSRHSALDDNEAAMQTHNSKRKVLIIGTDIPDISTALLQAAVAALDTADVVIGPAKDGGYYLIGMTNIVRELFHGMAWSTSSVLEQTVAVAQRLGLAVAPLDTLPCLHDIDVIDDLRDWMQQYEHDTSCKRHTCQPDYQTSISNGDDTALQTHPLLEHASGLLKDTALHQRQPPAA